MGERIDLGQAIKGCGDALRKAFAAYPELNKWCAKVDIGGRDLMIKATGSAKRSSKEPK